MSALENETLYDTTTFENLGREWTVPTKRHLSHLRKLRDDIRSGIGNIDLVIAETFLTADQFDALLEIDPDEDQLSEFTSAVSKAMGLGESGNSSPSSASS